MGALDLLPGNLRSDRTSPPLRRSQLKFIPARLCFDYTSTNSRFGAVTFRQQMTDVHTIPGETATMKIPVSKKFKGMMCAYCVKAKATTDDHVFAREFFTVEDRQNLPKAPACPKCNNEKSKFEHYLTAVLPFAGKHPQAAANLEGGVPGRLAKNQKLSSELIGSMRPAWLREEGGLYQQTGIFDFDHAKLEGFLKYVGRGLAWHHWKVYLRPDDEVSVLLMTDAHSALFASVTSSWRNVQRVVGNLGNGTVQYVGVQAADPPELTLWTISMYGGLVLSDDRRKIDGQMQPCSMWWVITGPNELNEGFNRLKR